MDNIILTSKELHSRAWKPQCGRMRALSAMIFLAVCALVVIIYQAVQQEINIRNMKTRIAVSTDQVKLKEDGIMSTKLQVEEMNKKISPVNTQKDQLKKQRDENKKAIAQLDKDTNTCKADKDKLEKQKAEASDAVQKIKVDQEAERKKAEIEIEGLKQNILDRDMKICKFVDLKVDEARILCTAGKQ
ncbi:uncharacterized protein [Paramisgurnus dabryanus]|uniref:uncharacterized protein n=1 Tax=Paramisgurnus dabryanus TaxID=90735 RepID=UPI0031F39298